MASRPLAAPANTFVIRMWPEWSEQGPAWRGQVVHLQSGQTRGFQDSAAMLAFIDQVMEQGLPSARHPSPPPDS